MSLQLYIEDNVIKLNNQRKDLYWELVSVTYTCSCTQQTRVFFVQNFPLEYIFIVDIRCNRNISQSGCQTRQVAHRL